MVRGERRDSKKESYWREMVRGQSGSGMSVRAWCRRHALTEAACWAHARRKFYEARTSDAAGSAQALAYIRLLYDIEDAAKQRFRAQADDHAPAGGEAARIGEDARADTDDARVSGKARTDGNARRSLAAIRLALRRERAVPLLEQFGQWLHTQQAAEGGPVLPKSPLGQAITYTRNQWSALNVYTTDGDLAIDNNASENALRRVALGRKNWLFCGSDNGGQTAAVLLGLIATCQRHNVEPLAYFRRVLTQIAAHPVTRLAELLPTAPATN